MVRVRSGVATLSQQAVGEAPTVTELAIADVPEILELPLGLTGSEMDPDERLHMVE